MTSTTPSPVLVTDLITEGDDARTRRFGIARALGLAAAAFLGGYLAHLALDVLVTTVDQDQFGRFNPFGDAGTDGWRQLFQLLAYLLGALAGLMAVFGLAARRWAIGVFFVTLLAVASQAGHVLLTLDSAGRDAFMKPHYEGLLTEGLAFTISTVGLQLVIALLCLIPGPKPELIVREEVIATATPAIEDDPEDDTMATSQIIAASESEPTSIMTDAAADQPDDEQATPEAEDSSSDDMFLIIHGQEYGPYPPERVRGFMSEGRIHAGTLVRIGDETKPASQIPEITAS